MSETVEECRPINHGPELADAHWDWFKTNLYEVFRVGYILGVSASGEEYTEEALKEAWELIERLIGRVYMDSMVHGFKHGVEYGSMYLSVTREAERLVEESLKGHKK